MKTAYSEICLKSAEQHTRKLTSTFKDLIGRNYSPNDNEYEKELEMSFSDLFTKRNFKLMYNGCCSSKLGNHFLRSLLLTGTRVRNTRSYLMRIANHLNLVVMARRALVCDSPMCLITPSELNTIRNRLGDSKIFDDILKEDSTKYNESRCLLKEFPDSTLRIPTQIKDIYGLII